MYEEGDGWSRVARQTAGQREHEIEEREIINTEREMWMQTQHDTPPDGKTEDWMEGETDRFWQIDS